MAYYQMGEIETRFADIIWREEPIRSPELVTICERELNWKKSTTYTVLRRLCQKGIFKNENCVVTSLMSKDEFLAGASDTIVRTKFGGSLPAFVAAFTSKKSLKKEEIDELRAMLDKLEKKK